MYNTYDYGYSIAAREIPSGLMLLAQILPFVFLGLGILMLVAWGKLFAKAGLPWERIFVPFYGAFWTYKVDGAQAIFWTNLGLTVILYGTMGLLGPDSALSMILFLICVIASLVLGCIYCVRLAKSYGKGGGFAVGLILLPFIFIPILGLGNAVYVSPYWKGMENHQNGED